MGDEFNAWRFAAQIGSDTLFKGILSNMSLGETTDLLYTGDMGGNSTYHGNMTEAARAARDAARLYKITLTRLK